MLFNNLLRISIRNRHFRTLDVQLYSRNVMCFNCFRCIKVDGQIGTIYAGASVCGSCSVVFVGVIYVWNSIIRSHKNTRKSSCVNARGIPPARGRKMLTPPPPADWPPPPPPPTGLTWAPPPRCEQTENITFPHPSDADGKYQTFKMCSMKISSNIKPKLILHVISTLWVPLITSSVTTSTHLQRAVSFVSFTRCTWHPVYCTNGAKCFFAQFLRRDKNSIEMK